MPRVKVTRSVRLPSHLRLARYLRAPELGPKVLFFSGGTALRKLCYELTRYTHHSIHLITPFDSGGSSAALRAAFDMPAVGDLRNRLMALADYSVQGAPDVVRLFKFRFPQDADAKTLRRRLERMIAGEDALMGRVLDPMRSLIANQLGFFREQMPADFDLRGASVGNLILAGGYLNNRRHLDTVVFLFSKLAEVHGVVRPITEASLHLAAELEDGTRVLGQHLLTRRGEGRITSPVKRLMLAADLAAGAPATVEADERTHELIESAELVCYPMGSFYSSMIANLLPGGVARAIRETDCPKVYVANTGVDPEQCGRSVADSVAILLETLRAGDGAEADVSALLDFVVVDSANGSYPNGLEIERIEQMGVPVIDAELVTERSAPAYDNEKLLGILLSLT